MPVSRPFTDPAARILRIVDRQDRRFQRAFTQAVEMIRDSRSLEEIARLLERGLFEEALDALEAAAAVLGAQYSASLTAAADEAAQFLSGALNVIVAFDGANQRAVDMMRQNQLRLIQRFTQEQRDVTRAALVDGIERGLNPRDQARLFRDTVGLTPYQEQAVRNYRALLTGGRDGAPSTQALERALRDGRWDRSVQRAIRQGDSLSPQMVERMVGRYRERFIKYRAEVIGRTEALRAVHQGTEEMYRQAIELGQFRPDQVVQTWVTAGDGRVRDTHQALNGVEQPVGGVWSAAGGDLRYPGDPDAPASETVQCRCVISRRIKPPSENRNA